MNTESPPSMANVPPQQPGEPVSPSAVRPARRKRHWGAWVLILLVVVLGVAAFLLFHHKKPKPPPPPPVSVTVTNVVKGDIDVSVTALGSVQPVYTATMSPRVDGQLLSVNYIEGQMVASNDLLAVIDPGPFQAQVTEAAGQLDRDKALLEGAKIDLGRYQTAYVKKAVPQQQVDDQSALVHQDEGTVKVDEGQVANAKVQLDYCYIRAPFSGRVGLRMVDPGNVVHAANTNAVVVVTQLEPITVVFNVAEDYLPQLQEQLKSGEPMAVEAWDRADEKKITTGSVLALNNLIDTATGTVRLKASFQNKDLALFPNQFVNAKLIIKTLHDVCLIPTFAIQHNPDGAFVYIVTNVTMTTNGMTTNYSAVTMRTIIPGTADGNITSVPQGLEPGEVIALDNFNKLGEGVKVAAGQNEHAGGRGKHRQSGSYGKKADDSKESP